MLGGWAAAFSANDWATGLLMDLVLVTAMMIALAIKDRTRLGGRWGAAILASRGLSVSMSLTLYLILYTILIGAYISAVFYLALKAGSPEAKRAAPAAHGPALIPGVRLENA